MCEVVYRDQETSTERWVIDRQRWVDTDIPVHTVLAKMEVPFRKSKQGGLTGQTCQELQDVIPFDSPKF